MTASPTLRRAILSFFGTGYLRPAPGTWGSAVAIPAAWGLHALGSWPLLLAGAVVAYAAGLALTRAETEGAADHDPSWIVIDEVAGQWIALLPVSFGAAFAATAFWALWPGVVTAFLAFRFFDIRKPWLVGRADARGDARGVMDDDVWAGVFAALTVVVAGVLAHAVMLA